MTGDRRLAYTGARSDLIALLPPMALDRLPVLDVGCSNGATGEVLMRQRHVSVIGVEADPSLAEEARHRLARVEEGDAMEAVARLVKEGVEVSAVILGDVLEHLVDPWACIDLLQSLMPAGGYMAVSIPNVAHIDTFISLLRGTWPMRDRGIHDSSHLRFFARKDLAGLFNRGRAAVVRSGRIYRVVERPHFLNRLAPLVGWVWPNGFTFQFHVLVQVRPRAA